ncbi:MAG: phosphocarrier protein HPr [Candidatus Latescibacteria bacterium 4484_7]|nr:MAG: phosphocarrier protein HPr [Candidatus Latescibacteria bacterium 4484_7]
MVTRTVKVKNKNGIHLRLAGELVKAASMFSSEIMISKDSQEVNAKSILGVASLGAEYGAELVIKADGEDEEEAVSYLVKMIDSGFAEVKDE